MKIAISAESTVDLTKELREKFDISIVPFSINLGDKVGLDGEITPQEIFDYVSKSKELPKTSAVNEEQFKEHFSNLLKDNDAIIHFSLSSDMSSAYNNAVNASKNFENVFVIDSRSLSTGIALLTIYARKLANKNLDVKEIVQKCTMKTQFVQASFVLSKLNYLYKGGRCNSLQLFGANLLRLRPQIIVDKGKMRSAKKYRGNFEKCVNNYCIDTLNQFNSPDLDTAFVTYTTAEPEVIEIAKKHLKERGFKNIYETTASGTITSHCGENCLGILYINNAD